MVNQIVSSECWFMLTFCSWRSVVVPKMWRAGLGRRLMIDYWLPQTSVCLSTFLTSPPKRGNVFRFSFFRTTHTTIGKKRMQPTPRVIPFLLHSTYTHKIIMSTRSIVSYTVTFLAGCFVGHVWNADELTTYRSLHESNLTRFRRHARQVSLGVLVMGSLWTVLRVVSRPPQQKL